MGTSVSGPDADPAGISVLVVDDHPMWREAVARDLEARGFVVAGTADSVAAAGRIAKAVQPSVVLMDMSLPDGNGAAGTALVLEAAPTSYTSGTPFAALAQWLRRFFGIEQSDRADAASARVAHRVTQLDPGLAESVPALLSVLRVPVKDEAWRALHLFQPLASAAEHRERVRREAQGARAEAEGRPPARSRDRNRPADP